MPETITLDRVAEALAGQRLMADGVGSSFANGWRAALLAVQIEIGGTLRTPEAFAAWETACQTGAVRNGQA
jgi:hypothetical protein